MTGGTSRERAARYLSLIGGDKKAKGRPNGKGEIPMSKAVMALGANMFLFSVVMAAVSFRVMEGVGVAALAS